MDPVSETADLDGEPRPQMPNSVNYPTGLADIPSRLSLTASHLRVQYNTCIIVVYITLSRVTAIDTLLPHSLSTDAHRSPSTTLLCHERMQMEASPYVAASIVHR